MTHFDGATNSTTPPMRPLRGSAVALAGVFLLLAGAAIAHAEDRLVPEDGAALAYAEPAPDGAFAFQPYLDEMPPVDGHPLNDAWMGMSVVTADGETVGYVSDAFVEPDGSIGDLVVTPGEGGALRQPVLVAPRYVLLGETTVTVDMTLAVLKAQEPAAAALAALD